MPHPLRHPTCTPTRRGDHPVARVAEWAGNQIVGSASCQLSAGLYPDILEVQQRKYGYIWGVYVQPDRRRRGIARALTGAAVDDLRGSGCTHALLHASPSGRPVYAALEFQASNELRLELLARRERPTRVK